MSPSRHTGEIRAIRDPAAVPVVSKLHDDD